MYANLEVSVDGEDEPLMAWKVDIGPTGATVHLDAQNGTGSYAQEARTRQIAGRKLTIRASF